MKRTPEGWPAQEYRSDVTLRFVAPPPKITFNAPKAAEPIKVDKAQYPIQASFQPGEAGVTYRAWYAQESLGKKISSRSLASPTNGIAIVVVGSASVSKYGVATKKADDVPF